MKNAFNRLSSRFNPSWGKIYELENRSIITQTNIRRTKSGCGNQSTASKGCRTTSNSLREGKQRAMERKKFEEITTKNFQY